MYHSLQPPPNPRKSLGSPYSLVALGRPLDVPEPQDLKEQPAPSRMEDYRSWHYL